MANAGVLVLIFNKDGVRVLAGSAEFSVASIAVRHGTPRSMLGPSNQACTHPLQKLKGIV